MEYADVAARARELGCRVPSRIALLPGNFAVAASVADFLFHEVAPQVRLAWRSIGIADTGPLGTRDWGLGTRVRIPEQTPSPESLTPVFEKVPLTVFFGADLLRDPARPVLHAIGVVASVLLLDDPSSANAREARLDAVVERPSSRGYVCLEYRGDACELVALARSVRAIWDEDMYSSSTSSSPNTSLGDVCYGAVSRRAVRDERRVGDHYLQEVRKVVVTK
ncbi:MAG TPA: hypothetical protein VMH22_10405 [bacterium]|nr:hypothetical protein [bacterium]